MSAAASAGASYGIRVLDAQHDRAAFVCGVEALDRWFHEQAGQSQRKRRTSVWVATEAGNAALPLGYYSLAPFHLAFAEAPPALLKRLPPEPIYVALIARLAVAASARGKGLGGVLLVDALKRAHRASLEVPTHAVVVHAKDQPAAAFYRHFGFLPFPDDQLHLFLPMAAVAALR